MISIPINRISKGIANLKRSNLHMNVRALRIWLPLSVCAIMITCVLYLLGADIALVSYVLAQLGLTLIGSAIAYHISLTDVMDRITVRIHAEGDREMDPKAEDLKAIVELDISIRQYTALLILSLVVLMLMLRILNLSFFTRLISFSTISMLSGCFLISLYEGIRRDYKTALASLISVKGFRLEPGVESELVRPWYKLTAGLAGFILPLQVLLHVTLGTSNSPFILALLISAVSFFSLSALYDNAATKLLVELGQGSVMEAPVNAPSPGTVQEETVRPKDVKAPPLGPLPPSPQPVTAPPSPPEPPPESSDTEMVSLPEAPKTPSPPTKLAVQSTKKLKRRRKKRRRKVVPRDQVARKPKVEEVKSAPSGPEPSEASELAKLMLELDKELKQLMLLNKAKKAIEAKGKAS